MKIFLGVSSFQMLAMFRRGLFYSFLTIYLRHFLGLSVTTTTLFATLPMVLNVVFQRYVWGPLSDRYQKRRTLIIWGEILGGIGTIALWYCHLIPDEKANAGWVVIIGLSIIEIFWSMSNIGWSALISDIYKQEVRSRIMGKLESLGGIGRIAGILIGGLLYDGMGSRFPGWGFWEGSLFFVSAAVMFLSVFPMFLVPEGGMNHPSADGKIFSDHAHYSPIIFFVFILAMVFIHFGRNSIAVTLAQYLTLETGFNLSSITLSHVVNIKSVGIILTGIVTGRLTEKFGPRNLLVVGTVFAICSLLILGISHSLIYVCISSFIMGFSEILILATSYELASSYIPASKRGKLFSIFNATYFLSFGVAGTLIAGPITDFLISRGKTQVFAYMVSFNTAAILTSVGIIILFILFRLEKKSRL
ncbi:MAG: MFS transporter [Desulfobacula sp.]|jgi:MFS family permease|nr:MFS transporter [Desulfobacula sp.]